MPKRFADFNKPYNPKEVEEKIYRLWEKSGFFNPDKLPDAKKGAFTIVIPPPNVTGTLHLGHALNAVIQDILIRKKRMEGYKTLWLPGTDHAGIATQNVVEKELKKQGIFRYDLGREKFLEKVWEWKEKYGNIILDQLKKLGCSMDWSRTRFTMDPNYQKAVQEAFLHYHKKGWIYQAERVINWCVRCATSLSDLELEYEEQKDKLYYIKYPIKNPRESAFVIVATTRPETMLGDSAVAVNPKDKRYKDLTDKEAILPIQNRRIPIIVDKAVDMKFGTGAVKVTPAHDMTDSEIGERHKLIFYKIIGPNGKMTKEAGLICEGLKISECRSRVIEELKRQNLLQKEEPYKHNVARCYRCGTIIEPLPSLQWFLKMGELAKMAIKAVKSGKIKFHPKRWEKVYFDWLKNIKDWCISRQIWWGHKIPLDGVDDVLDTWFSSALWPFAILGWPDACEQNQKSKIKNQKCRPIKNSDLDIFYPTQVLSTARDIINLWVARMVFSGIEFMGQEPFKDVIIHATILTKEGKRMSKSLGTGVDPMDLIEKYGADATRFGLIWQATAGQDIHWAEDHVVAGKKFCNKLWNIARFVLENTKGVDINAEYTKENKIVRNVFEKLIVKNVNNNIEIYRFDLALKVLYEYIWHKFADMIIEHSKTVFKIGTDQEKDSQKKLIFLILKDSIKLLHPFMPFITEEIYQNLLVKDKNLLLIEPW